MTDDDRIPTDDAIAGAVRTALTRTVSEEPPSPLEWARVSARARRRVRVRRVAALATGLVVVAGATVAIVSTTGNDKGVTVNADVSTSTTAPPPDAAREQAATALANQMLTEAVVPAGTARSDAEPPPILHGPGIDPALTGNLVDAHGLWTAPGKPGAIAAYAVAHVPNGFSGSGPGTETTPEAKAWLVEQSLSALPANTFRAELQWAVTDAGDGTSLVRIDAVVGWIPTVQPRTPLTPSRRVTVAGGCPATLAGNRDIDNPAGERGPLLLPSGPPASALICSYAADDNGRKLIGQRRFAATDASALAGAVNHITLIPDIGMHSCPPDPVKVKILVFAFPGRADADLWWHANGCESLDNGYLSTSETMNPSFYNDFAGTVYGLHG